MRNRLLAICVILIGAAGCDNVSWNGAELRIRSPARDAEAHSADSAAAVGVGMADPTEPRFLLAGVRAGSRARLHTVAMIGQGGLRSFFTPPGTTPEALRLGTVWTLFSEGTRVGTMVADSVAHDAAACDPALVLSGPIELVPDAAPTDRFLALAASEGSRRPYGPYSATPVDASARAASPALAAQALTEAGGRARVLPREMQRDRADLRSFRVDADGPIAFAASFLRGDTLAVAPATDEAYALFLIAEPTEGGYALAFASYRDPASEGKGAARLFDHLDWDGDGSGEILLEVFGAERRWYAALEREGTRWEMSYQAPCGTALPATTP